MGLFRAFGEEMLEQNLVAFRDLQPLGTVLNRARKLELALPAGR
jgi:hypothetical protein